MNSAAAAFTRNPAASRSEVVLARYAYLGLARTVERESEQPGLVETSLRQPGDGPGDRYAWSAKVSVRESVRNLEAC